MTNIDPSSAIILKAFVVIIIVALVIFSEWDDWWKIN